MLHQKITTSFSLDKSTRDHIKTISKQTGYSIGDIMDKWVKGTTVKGRDFFTSIASDAGTTKTNIGDRC